jgi:hypothetical protein
MPCAAITLRSEAHAGVDRLQVPLARARQLVEELERRQQEHATAVTAGESAAAAKLIEDLGVALPDRQTTLAAGETTSPDDVRRDL